VDGERPRHGLAAVAAVEQAFVQGDLRAALALLARLEQEPHPPGQRAAAVGQHAGGADQHRGVGVVAAGVHRPVDLGPVVQVGVVGHGQRVHVGPQQDRRAGPGAVEVGHDRRLAGAQRDAQRQAVERLEHPGLGQRQVEAQLRPAVQVAAEGDDVVEQRAGLGQHVARREGDGGTFLLDLASLDHGPGVFQDRRLSAWEP
jgi:hypothetical protein